MPLASFFFTGFEFGMVGVALFTSIFGQENLHFILLLGLGHEFFILFVYAPLLESRNHGSVQVLKIFKSFLTSPIILAILSSLLLNLTGWYQEIRNLFWVEGLISGAGLAGSITTPLILLVIGFQLKITAIAWKQAGVFIGTRLILVFLVGTGFYFWQTS